MQSSSALLQRMRREYPAASWVAVATAHARTIEEALSCECGGGLAFMRDHHRRIAQEAWQPWKDIERHSCSGVARAKFKAAARPGHPWAARWAKSLKRFEG
jgi:hypothetical protein